MIADLNISVAVDRRDAGPTLPALHRACAVVAAQPVADVAKYLEERRPQADCLKETHLLCTLPATEQIEVRCLNAACFLVADLVKAGLSVQAACQKAIALNPKRFWKLSTFRNCKYDPWARERDWIVLVNRAKATAVWRKANAGLSDAFLDHCASRFGSSKGREDTKRQALLAIKRHWRTGRNDHGEAVAIPGYEKDWNKRDTENFPAGWSYSNVTEQIKARGKLPKAVAALMQQGIAAARDFLPQTHGTRRDLRFLELVEFDDIKCDFRIISEGAVMDLWLLIARDKATNMLLGFGMRPARKREDGSQEHLKLRDMKQLCGWLLETYGLPPYVMKWKLERGTATLNRGSVDALNEFLGGRVVISYSGMIAGKSPVGYEEKAIGNSGAKGSLESTNRLQHTIGANLPGQTGPAYSQRPSDLLAREAEAVAIWELAQFLPEDVRGQAKYPLLTITEARQHLFRIFEIQNHRVEHALEGFKKVGEWFDGAKWQPAATAPDRDDLQVRTRMEKPIERAGRLVAGLEFTRVGAEIITAFYEHTARTRPVEDNGEINLTHEGTLYRFMNPGTTPLVAGTKVLCYFHPDDPRFLHLTTGKGESLGTWLRRDLASDRDSVSAAIHYAASALKAAKEMATGLAAPETARLVAMREHNARLLEANTFIDVTEPGVQGQQIISSPIATGLAGARAVKQQTKQQEQDQRAERNAAREALRNLAS